jgi:uncharacterized protein YgiM (DUF1202 family)
MRGGGSLDGLMRYRATTDFEVDYRRPLEVQPGEALTVGRRDETWPGWCWVTDSRGESGWMHESMFSLTDPAGGRAEVLQSYCARELSVRREEVVTSLRELGGWHWVRREDGEEGWIPAYTLKPVDATEGDSI